MNDASPAPAPVPLAPAEPATAANYARAAEPARPGVVRRALFSVYGLYVWSVFLAVALTAVAIALMVPGLERRRAAVGGCARAFLRLAGIGLSVRGLARLPAEQCVVVANHASYLDGVVMKAALPPRFAYVVKREMDSFPLAGLLLRRIGTEFVERFNRQRGASDARRMLRTATSGQSLVFFPEGTFSTVPGLLKFHPGAFTTAVRAGCPVVPAVIRGSRAILPSSRVLPWPGRVEIELLDVLTIDAAQGEHAAAELRERSRDLILQHVGEPDLARRGESPETTAAA
jgi:1-acyl-sn-glycerol-3-phosphate acyltransferase